MPWMSRKETRLATRRGGQRLVADSQARSLYLLPHTPGQLVSEWGSFGSSLTAGCGLVRSDM